ncbi:MAG: sugar ABC transporter ATP-binding protein [Lachnospiraceae bacterium]|nr:sugar ABC transporter ATP-binding protein [Lachnospiraceae bacterium]
MQKVILEMKNIEKAYGSSKVLKGVSLEISEGEVISLVGENGAGKSTLMNVLFGMPGIVNTGGYQGEIRWEGQPVKMTSPHQAMNLGIGMVHQEFMLLPTYTITENVKLNREITKTNVISRVLGKDLGTLDKAQMRRETQEALDKIHLNVNPSTQIKSMSVGYKQFVEIAREIDKKNIKLIVFDEPTAVLTDVESTWLLDTIKEITAAGVAVIFISHKLNEVLEISDKIVILRDGELVATRPKSEMDVKSLAKLMVGRNVDFSELAGRPAAEIESKEVIMQIKDLKVNMPGENAKGINLDIHKGEILGLCGLAGQGKLAVSNGISGMYPASGEVLYKGEALPFQKPLEVLKKGIGFVSEDRRGVGLLLDESIKLNICLLAMRIKKHFFKSFGLFGQMDQKEMRRISDDMIKEMEIKCVSCDQHPAALSGGNQQKVCIARAVVFNPDVLFVSEPTRGIDIGAKKVILDYLKNLNREKGITIVITSSELTELRSLCDRIAVVYDGKVKTVLQPTDSDEKFGLLMSGLDA